MCGLFFVVLGVICLIRLIEVGVLVIFYNVVVGGMFVEVLFYFDYYYCDVIVVVFLRVICVFRSVILLW